MTRPIDPGWIDVLHAWMEQYSLETHTAFPGKVESYDAAHQTVDVRPLVRHPVPQPDGTQEYEDLPVVPAVPVIFPRTAQWFFTLPIAVGDTVLVLCCESAIGPWWVGDGSPHHPGDLRRHHLSHAVAIPGLFTKAQSLPTADASTSDMVMGNAGGATMRITPGGDVIFSGGGIPVAKEGSKIDQHAHNINTGLAWAGPFKVTGSTDLISATIAIPGQISDVAVSTTTGSQHIKVP